MKPTNKNYSKYLDISKNEVKTKYKAIVRLLTDEYKINDNDLLDEEEFELMTGDTSSFNIPGTFEIEFPEQGITLNMFLPFTINLIKPEEFTVTSKEMVFYYEENEPIFNCYVKKVETNIDILNNMFENRVRYLRGHIEEQLEAIWSQIASTSNVRSCHLTLILSLLYATVHEGEEVLIRHTPTQEYKKEFAVNTKESSHLFNLGAQSFNYGYTNDALISSVFKNRYNSLSKFSDLYPDELRDIQTKQLADIAKERARPISKQALTYTIDKNLEDLRGKMKNGYSDLENVIAGRYDEINRLRDS